MHPEGIVVHAGINYVLSPPPKRSKKKYLDFQAALVDEGIDFDSGGDVPEVHIERKTPMLQIRVLASEQAPIGQLLITASQGCAPDAFAKETEAIVRAFNKTWDTPTQILSIDSTIRYLFDASGEHAFKELWETRLQQEPASLSAFKRPVLGGGLRFVMPPIENEDDPAQIEVKIESYLQDTSKIFVEVGYKWLQPKALGVSFDPKSRLMAVDNYIEGPVKNFIEGRRNEE